MCTTPCSRNDVVLLPIPFTDLSSQKVRPAVVIGTGPFAGDVFVVPVTSRLFQTDLLLQDWSQAGLNVSTVEIPNPAKSLVFRVASVSLSSKAVAARRASITGNGRRERISPQRSAQTVSNQIFLLILSLKEAPVNDHQPLHHCSV
jgi:mRNA interferase MazF